MRPKGEKADLVLLAGSSIVISFADAQATSSITSDRRESRNL